MTHSQPPLAAAPFVIEHRRRYHSPASFEPQAVLLLTPALRTSGLLDALPDEALHSLVLLLTFLTPNGTIHPDLSEVAAALDLSPRQTRERMKRLATVFWQGAPLAYLAPHESGLETVHVSRRVLAEAELPPPPDAVVNLPIPSHREEIVAQSRARYARPRAEVEQIIAEQLGHAPEEQDDSPEGEVRRRLVALGVAREQVDLLLAAHPISEVMQQLDWLPLRHAKSPARFIVAAITRRYAPPAALRQPEQEETHDD